MFPKEALAQLKSGLRQSKPPAVGFLNDVPDLQLYRIEPEGGVVAERFPAQMAQQAVASEHQQMEKNSPSDLTPFRATVKPPYYSHNRLRTSISWLDHPACRPEARNSFLFLIRTLRCVNELPP